MPDAAPQESVVHIIDDDEAARESLGFLLSTAGRAVRLYASAPDFLAAAASAHAGCIITDLRMPEMSGLDLIRAIKSRRLTPLPMIVVTGHGDVPLAVEAMKAGAIDFLEKPYSEEKLLNAVERALAADADAGDREARRAEVAQRIASLSGRERDVLRGLVKGDANKVIAAELGISPRTVEIYRANLMSKMRAGSLSELVRMALLAGVADP
ncbi:MAG: response regulator [Hydrogenophilaceae bacterium]|jgi:two-component system response regulator FixJ|nr:response regulator [Hydrogenophilaceae bacterium]